MTSFTNDNSHDGEAIFVIFATISSGMIEILNTLAANERVRTVTRGCDVRKYRDSMWADEIVLSFESYVEVETKEGQYFSWLFDLQKTPNVWEIRRVIDRQDEEGGSSVVTFGAASYVDVGELESAYSPLVEEFVASARTFEF